MLYISNAFSLAMLPDWRLTDAQSATRVTIEPVINVRLFFRSLIEDHGGFISAVGHPDTAAAFSELLDAQIPANRVSIKLGGDDDLLIGQFMGGRLPEGTTTLPPGLKIQWLHLAIES